MAKVVDITDKLTFDEDPILKIKGEEIAVNSDAPTVLKIMGIVGDDASPSALMDAADLLFPPASMEKIKNLKLNFNDYAKVVSAAIELASGVEAGDEGEA